MDSPDRQQIKDNKGVVADGTKNLRVSELNTKSYMIHDEGVVISDPFGGIGRPLELDRGRYKVRCS